MDIQPDRSRLRFSALLIVFISSILKVLLFPAYKSTDFDVHRNWLSITHSLPLNRWYFEKTSQWTLDYPPLFAYFEYALSLIAFQIDPKITQISSEPYLSNTTIYFQRSTVVICDLFLHCSCWRLLSLLASRNLIPSILKGSELNRSASLLYLFTLVVLNAGLFMVDHIHFQYNGVLFGLLLLCVDFALRDQFIALTFAFSVLVCSKHLFVYLAPPFGIYLLRKYCFLEDSCEALSTKESDKSQSSRSALTTNHSVSTPIFNNQSILRIIQLAVTALVPVTLAFGPFILQKYGFDQLLQIFRRLFPFGRGLVHSYWAPNIWALYCASDKVIGLLAKKLLGMTFTSVTGLASTSGLTGDFVFHVLPTVPPILSLLLVLLAQLPAWHRLWVEPHPHSLLPCLVYCSLCAYMLGYHVHEKAILISQVLAGLLALRSNRNFEIFTLLSVVGVYSQLPLLFPLYETPTKVLLWIMYSRFTLQGSTFLLEKSDGLVGRRIAPIVLTALLITCEGLLKLQFASQFPFLPLMLTSIMCAVFLVYAWYLSLLEITFPSDKPNQNISGKLQ